MMLCVCNGKFDDVTRVLCSCFSSKGVFLLHIHIHIQRGVLGHMLAWGC